jgi:hypothetical protein
LMRINGLLAACPFTDCRPARLQRRPVIRPATSSRTTIAIRSAECAQETCATAPLRRAPSTEVTPVKRQLCRGLQQYWAASNTIYHKGRALKLI